LKINGAHQKNYLKKLVGKIALIIEGEKKSFQRLGVICDFFLFLQQSISISRLQSKAR
jgi:hypothetical protein